MYPDLLPLATLLNMHLLTFRVSVFVYIFGQLQDSMVLLHNLGTRGRLADAFPKPETQCSDLIQYVCERGPVWNMWGCGSPKSRFYIHDHGFIAQSIHI